MRLNVRWLVTYCDGFQSTHPVWDATIFPERNDTTVTISIHASRMGCDFFIILSNTEVRISIHASRMGCDLD